MTDPYPDYPLVSDPDRSKWSKREDGSAKGDGWLGVRRRPDGGVSTEISAGVTINGKDVEVPLMVPGLTKQEMNYLMLNDPDLERNPNFFKSMPKSILQKASEFAKSRMEQGKSPFRQADEAMRLNAPDALNSMLRRLYPNDVTP